MANYQDQIARWRQERVAQERQEMANEMRREHSEFDKERKEALATGDRERFDYADTACIEIEQKWRQAFPPRPPQPHPFLVDLTKRNPAWSARPTALKAIEEVIGHQVNVLGKARPLDTPAGQKQFRDALELYYGLPAEDEIPTAKEIRVASSNRFPLTAEQYNASSQDLHKQGRFTFQNPDMIKK